VLPLFALAAVATARVSGPAVAPADQPIVVTGEMDTRSAVKQFVRALTPTLFAGQISRFEHSVCPRVVGLAPAPSRAIEQRIRLISKAAGIVVDKQPCEADIVLIVTTDKKAFIEQLRHRKGEYFGSMVNYRIRDLEREPGPAAGWEVRGPEVDAEGVPLDDDGSAAVASLPDVPTSSTIDQPSRLADLDRPQFDAAVVVVERRALVGMTVTQLADYVGIRALTCANPAKLKNTAAPTILHVLDVPIGGEAPVTITKWDFAFLKSFYGVNRTYHPSAQRSAITKSVTNTLDAVTGK
jgi:hypothetical protein